MSKKQREKVEEEVNFHQSQNRLRASSGTSPDPWHSTPDSTGPSNEGYQFQQYDLPQGTYPTNQYSFTGQQQQQPNGQQQYDEFVDSTTPNTTTPFDTRNGGNNIPGPDTDAQHLQGEQHTIGI